MNPLHLILQRRGESYQAGLLDMWTIYNGPKDFPGEFVARRFVLDQPTQDAFGGPTLAAVRQPFLDAGLYCMARADTDDPVIVETWL
jgi:hypothetical protein